MHAIVYDAYGEIPTLREVPAPECPSGGALIAVRATGVCRSDWHAWTGHDPVPLPGMIPGHEFAGVVAQVGAGVTQFRPGDRVTAPFVCGCGTCAYCRAGNAQVCPRQYQPGFSGPGSFAELVAIPGADTNLVHLPDRLGFTAAAALGCRVATAFRAVVHRARIEPGQWLAVWGCGGVGLAAQIAVAHGTRVVALDPSPAARERAATLGAVQTLNAADPDAAQYVVDRTGGGAHVSLDAIGRADVAAASIRCLRRRGRHVQVGLLLGEHADPRLPMGLVVAHELDLLGAHGMAAVDYPALLDLITAGRLEPEALVARRITLEQAGTELAAMSNPGSAGLVVVELA